MYVSFSVVYSNYHLLYPRTRYNALSRHFLKIWDLASGTLKLTLTGHINTVMGMAVSSRHPYLFSVGQDKLVKCWDLEQNKVVRSYHGHLSGKSLVLWVGGLVS
jgi:WD40 repeat protein